MGFGHLGDCVADVVGGGRVLGQDAYSFLSSQFLLNLRCRGNINRLLIVLVFIIGSGGRKVDRLISSAIDNLFLLYIGSDLGPSCLFK